MPAKATRKSPCPARQIPSRVSAPPGALRSDNADLQKLSDEDFGYLYRAICSTRLYAFGGVFKDCKSQAMIDLARERASEDRQWDTLERLVYTWLSGRYHLREDQPEEPIEQ